MTPWSEAYNCRMREHLSLLWWARGTPQKKLATAIDVNESQVSRRFSGKVRIQASDLAALLKAMDIDPTEFHAGMAGDLHAEVYLARIARTLGRQKNYAFSDLMSGAPSKPYTANELRELAEGLQDLRIVDAEAARVGALDVLLSTKHYGIDAGTESRFEAVLALAAVYRARGAYGTAASFLLKAVQMAGGRGRMRARALLALVPFAANQGDFDVGLEAADMAFCEFARLDDRQGRGRTLISKGSLLGQTGHLTEAAVAYTRSLPLVADDRWYQRFSALLGLGLCSVFKGEPSEALKHADRALAALESETVPPRQEAEARWLRAEILLKMGSSAGIAELRAVLDICSNKNVSKLTLALISLRLACAYHDDGQIEEAGKLTGSLSHLLRRQATNNQVLQGALAELDTMTIRGELSRGLLQRTYRALLKADRKAPNAAHLAMD